MPQIAARILTVKEFELRNSMRAEASVAKRIVAAMSVAKAKARARQKNFAALRMSIIRLQPAASGELMLGQAVFNSKAVALHDGKVRLQAVMEKIEAWAGELKAGSIRMKTLDLAQKHIAEMKATAETARRIRVELKEVDEVVESRCGLLTKNGGMAGRLRPAGAGLESDGAPGVSGLTEFSRVNNQGGSGFEKENQRERGVKIGACCGRPGCAAVDDNALSREGRGGQRALSSPEPFNGKGVFTPRLSVSYRTDGGEDVSLRLKRTAKERLEVELSLAASSRLANTLKRERGEMMRGLQGEGVYLDKLTIREPEEYSFDRANS